MMPEERKGNRDIKRNLEKIENSVWRYGFGQHNLVGRKNIHIGDLSADSTHCCGKSVSECG